MQGWTYPTLAQLHGIWGNMERQTNDLCPAGKGQCCTSGGVSGGGEKLEIEDSKLF